MTINYQAVDIIIVGAGPIGLSMAKALADTGLKIALIEKQSQDTISAPAFDGREIAITHRTKGIMQDLHQWQRLSDEQIYLLKKAEVYNGNSAFALGFDKPKTVHGKPIETLGYLISNQNIRQVAYDSLAPKFGDDLVPLFGETIDEIDRHHTHVTVKLKSGTELWAKLLIAADSRTSFVRRAVGISSDMHDFGRTVMVFRTTHTKPNHGIAHEGFYYGKTLAVLPLGELQSSMVITIDNSKVDEIFALSPAELAKQMERWLGGRLGEMTVTSKIYDYPLLGVHARTFYGDRVAVIGDAAVGMHPVTAHGYNLGMESVQILSNLILKAHAQNKGIASSALLRHYSHTHSLKTRAMYHGTNAIVKLYTIETPPARLLRHTALRATQGFLPIKKLITGQLTG